ncbi:hypothetical protein EGY07_07010 [Chryseobacterium indologenes]|uniref:Lipoprotein n=1 Tax=Chryseobacterium indologenes TaxID=253 RepID=A0AAD1DUQ2_CHRID|nr:MULTISPECIES: hypothetical protein [Chryseobacterium]AVK73263.1 hypothetical protein CEQ15_23100 [Chryseobacterium indologenes]AYY85570.1 hypothetical protein EGX91_13935 [Chryseobacterium indologenes]AYZ35338.1 hypothetical protein EGY07_07010 [Chryseobacterium indologenes]AZB17324.1 hypothetical protein EG352_05850 [Chryseobacterium indologenes]MBF6644080.1 hypothetical protein [Chryseobacterium indologenes]
MFEKIPRGYLLLAILSLFSCSPRTTTADKGSISIETISIITFVIVGISILMVYYTTKKK